MLLTARFQHVTEMLYGLSDNQQLADAMLSQGGQQPQQLWPQLQ